MKSCKLLLLRLASLVLTLSLLFSFAACEKSPSASFVDTLPATDVAATPETNPLPFKITDNYKIIRPDIEDTNEVEAMKLVKRGLDSLFGTKLGVATDWTKRDAEVVPGEYEILIGATNRTQSVEAMAKLTRLDYYYEVVSENVIVICGGCPESTLKATRAFLSDLFGYKESDSLDSVISAGSVTDLTPGVSYLSEYDYPVKSLTLGTHDISEYTIVSTRGNCDATRLINAAFEELCGVGMPVVKPAAYTSGPAIFLGCGGADGKHLDKIFDSYTYYITASGDNIIIDLTTNDIFDDAAERFIAEYIPDNASGTLKLEIKTDLITGLAVNGETNGLTIKKRTDTTVATGITYTEILYSDSNSKPVRVYALSVASGAGRFYTGTPEDGTDIYDKNATVLAEIKSAAANGKNVIAGVNADFFNMGGDDMPRGLCVKEGTLLNEAGGRPWFAVLSDGTPVIGAASDYSKYADSILNAVGGSHILLANNRLGNLGLGTEFGYTRHPRTAVGFCEDGTVVMLEVDGRQSSISNGASLADLALIFRDFGCSDAINLDGGGSSTFILRTAANTYVTKNSPSDGSLRRVQNSLLVLLPE